MLSMGPGRPSAPSAWGLLPALCMAGLGTGPWAVTPQTLSACGGAPRPPGILQEAFSHLITHSTSHQEPLVGRSHSRLLVASVKGTCSLAQGGVVF